MELDGISYRNIDFCFKEPRLKIFHLTNKHSVVKKPFALKKGFLFFNFLYIFVVHFEPPSTVFLFLTLYINFFLICQTPYLHIYMYIYIYIGSVYTHTPFD